MISNIKKLIWDSDFFGYKIGKYTISNGILDEDFQKLASQFKLVYIFSSCELELNRENLFFVDKKVTLSRKTEKINLEDQNIIASYKGELTNELLNLTLESGVFSRFFYDKNFTNGEYKKLYTQWIFKSLNEDNIKVFICYDKAYPAGFITVQLNSNKAEIGLLAVDKKFRGKSIGTSIVNHAICISYESGCNHIDVVTQHQNQPAMKLYQKCGFEITDVKYIYHFWNNR